MAEVPKALDDCLRQSRQWQWKSKLGLEVGVVNLTVPQAQEPFMTGFSGPVMLRYCTLEVGRIVGR